MKACIELLTFFIVLTVQHILRLLPLRAALAIGTLLGRAAFAIGIRRATVEQNLRAVFPDKTRAELLTIARNTYINSALSMVEYLRIPWMTKDEINSLVTLEGFEYLDEQARAGRGVLLVGGHFGNWEMFIAAVANRGYRLQVLAATQHNIMVDALNLAVRKAHHVEAIPRGIQVRALVRGLKQGAFVGLLFDQDARRDGIFAPFFGRPAATHHGPAQLALLTGIGICYGRIVRLANGRHIIRFDAPLQPSLLENRQTAVYETTLLLNQKLERDIIAHPDHWFWYHKRWKTRPEKDREQDMGRSEEER